MIPSVFKVVAALLLAAHSAAAFAPPVMLIPITNSPSLDSEKGKAAGIGGLSGPKPPSFGGIGSAGINSDKGLAANKAARKAGATNGGKKKVNAKAKPVEKKKPAKARTSSKR